MATPDAGSFRANPLVVFPVLLPSFGAPRSEKPRKQLSRAIGLQHFLL